MSRLGVEPVTVTVTARTIQVRDVISVGGRRARVESVEPLHNGARCRLADGDLLVLGNGREFTVERAGAGTGVAAAAAEETPAGAQYDDWSPWCLAASAGPGLGWAVLHAECKGPAAIAIPGHGTLRLRCGCPCHETAAPS